MMNVRQMLHKLLEGETCLTFQHLKQEKYPCFIAHFFPLHVFFKRSKYIRMLLHVHISHHTLNVLLWPLKYTLKCCIILHFSAMDEETGEIPVAFVVKKVGSVLSPKHVMDYVAEQVRLDKANF